MADGGWTRGAWLLGLGLCVQPFAILAVPALSAYALRVSVVRDRKMVGFFARLLIPYLVLLVPALVFDHAQAITWLTKQPNYPTFNHITPLTRFATKIPHSLGGVTSGPGRVVGIVAATVASILVCERNRGRLDVALWAVLASFWLWLLTESVLDAYYVWPVLALAIVLSARRRTAVTVVVSAVAVGADWFANHHVHDPWLWWGVLMGGLSVLGVLSIPPRMRLWRAVSAAEDDLSGATRPDTAARDPAGPATGGTATGGPAAEKNAAGATGAR
jgi:hypothetical protein